MRVLLALSFEQMIHILSLFPGDLEIAKKSQNPQNTCSKNQGAYFVEEKKAPAAGT